MRARAFEDPTPAYDAPPECPGSEAFVSEIERRKSAGRQATHSLPAGLRVSITSANAASYHGRLHLEGGQRDVDAATCTEVVQALALAAAMAADEVDEVAVAVASPTRVSATNDRVDAPAKSTSSSDSGVHPSMGFGVGGTSAAAPGLSPTLGVFGGLDWARSSIRLSASAARSGEVRVAAGAVGFDRWAGRVTGCPTAIRAAFLRVAPCAGIEAGALVGSGLAVVNAETRSLLWLSLAAGARVGWELSQGVFVEAEGGAELPLLRHTFVVRPSGVVFAVPGLAAGAALAVGYRFPK